MTPLSKDLQEFIRWLDVERVELKQESGRPRQRPGGHPPAGANPAEENTSMSAQDLRHAPNRATQGRVHAANTMARFLCLLVFLLAQPATLNAPSAIAQRETVDQFSSTNPGLGLDRKGSSVELPPNIFANLTRAMAEACAEEESHGPCATQSLGSAC